jgi:hypothetical protein
MMLPKAIEVLALKEPAGVLRQSLVMAPRLFVPSESSPKALPKPSCQRHGRHGTWESFPLSASLLTVFFVGGYSI